MDASSRHKPTLVVVSGRPGSGKSTLARQLAIELACPLVSRDEINEGICHTVDHDPAVASKDQVAKAAFDAFFAVIELLVSSGVTLVAEAAFQDLRWRIGLEPILAAADIKVIHCTVDPELARERVTRRREHEDAGRSRRRGTAAKDVPGMAAFAPVSLPVPSISVATTDGYDPPMRDLLRFITSRQESGPS